MTKKTDIKQEPPKYVNIPVAPSVYEGAQLVAEAKGFGKRGLGALVAHWVGMELPECEHEKEAVSIETFTNGTSLVRSVKRVGYYCPTCQRVYERVSGADLDTQDGKRLLTVVKVGKK